MAFMYRIIKLLLALFLILFAVGSPCASLASPRVISLYAAHTENVVALGAASFLVGISVHDDPALLPDLPRIAQKVGAETLMALKPDIVLTRSFSVRQNSSLYKILNDARITVATIDPPTWDNFADYLRELAALLHVDPNKAVELFKKTGDKIALEAAARSNGKKQPLVFVESTSIGLRTCAGDSWAACLIELAGGRNVAADVKPVRKGSSVAAWGLERILSTIKSGLDIYIVQQGAMNASSAEDVRNRPWAAALKDTKVVAVPEAYLSRPSLFGLERGGKMLLDIFYGSIEISLENGKENHR